MSDLYELIAARVRDLCPDLVDVRAATSAAELAGAPTGPIPVVHVVPAAERWSAVSEAGFRVVQSGRLAFSCIVALTFPSGFAEWTQTRQALRACLLGWTPTEAAEVNGPIEATGARLLTFSPDDGGRWLHAFDFIVPAQATIEVQS